MQYRQLGKTGLSVSVIGFGNMINYKPEDEEENVAIIKKAIESGINFFDTAENYAAGQAEEALGRAFKKLNIPREMLVVSTKLFNRTDGTGNQINRSATLSRKHIIEGTDASLKRLQLEYVDLIFAHVFDPITPMEEICQGFNQVIEDGKAFYWATSNWTATQIQDAINICDKLGLHRPVADQCQYNMLERKKVEVEFGPLFDKFGYGTTIWSPLSMGLLSGKYNNKQIPEESRFNQGMGWVPKEVLNNLFFNKIINSEKLMSQIEKLGQVAESLGVSQAQLSIAWVIKNKDVSTAIAGARSVKQLEDTLESLKVIEKITPEVSERIENILQNKPQAYMDWRQWAPSESRR